MSSGVTQGRAFERTQTMPSFHSPTLDQSEWSTSSSTFITDTEAISRAREAINKEDLRRRELQPYSKTLIESAPRIRGSSPALGDGLYFQSDGIDQDDMDWEGEGSTAENGVHGKSSSGSRARSKKRRATAEPEDDEGDATDVDDDDLPESGRASGLGLINGASGTRSSLPVASMSNLDDFPPVFTSPEISQPELFSNHSSSSDIKLRPPGLREAPVGRPTRGMPRMLGKTMSAPVGQLGRFDAARLEARGSGLRGQGMQVDDEMEDGFDVTGWAASEEF